MRSLADAELNQVAGGNRATTGAMTSPFGPYLGARIDGLNMTYTPVPMAMFT